MKSILATIALLALASIAGAQTVDYTLQGGPSCYVSTTAWCYASVLKVDGTAGGTIWTKQDGELRFYDASGNLAWTSTNWNPTTGSFSASDGQTGVLDVTFSQVRTCRRGQCYYYTHISGGTLEIN